MRAPYTRVLPNRWVVLGYHGGQLGRECHREVSFLIHWQRVPIPRGQTQILQRIYRMTSWRLTRE